MTTLDIDRLRAHYHDVDPVRLSVLDESLRELADHVLDDELAGDGLADALASVWAVCIGELVVAVDLDPSRSTHSVAASWAHAILEAVTGAVDGVDSATGAVVYRREADALIDLVTAFARGDLSRLWAWRQVGLLSPSVLQPTQADVAAAALARPSLIPAVLTAAGPACRAVFRVDDWIRLADAVARHVGSPHEAEPGHTGVRGAAPTRSPDAAVRPDRWLPKAGAWATVPARVWAAVADGRDRWSLAVLCQVVAGPRLARDRSAIGAIVDEAPPHLAPAVRPRPATPGSDPRESFAGPREPDDAEWSDADGAVTSAWGGVWFLAHALLELGVVDGLSAGPVGLHDVLDALTAIVVAVTGAPADDPSVSGLCGRGAANPAWAPTPVQEHQVGRWATAITAWLAERADGRLAARLVRAAAGEGSLWRRTATIETSPGRVEITSSLRDVDIDIRMAGLDIDPGFVWWLGADVGFRYV